MHEVIDVDVLVIGGGAAGARAAIEANRHACNVLMVVKDKFLSPVQRAFVAAPALLRH